MPITARLPRRVRTRLAAGLLALTASGAVLAGLAVSTAGPADAASAATAVTRSSSGLEIGGVKYDSDGSDSGSTTSLNGEWVRIENHSSHGIDVTGYRLHDRSSHLYVIPHHVIAAHDKLYVHTGSHADTAHHVYQDRGWYVWNNTGDTAYLNDPSTNRVDTCSWGDGDGYTTC